MARPSAPGFYALTLLNVGCFALFYVALWHQTLTECHGSVRSLLFVKALLELLASFYFFSILLKSFAYMLGPESTAERAVGMDGATRDPESCPPIACLYLTAGDLDPRALESLCSLDYPGPLHIFVHDDSGDERITAGLEVTVRALRGRHLRPISLLRRPSRTGGKPGAVNYVLSRLEGRYPFVLLADSDSIAADPRALRISLPLLGDPRVAAVQFRNVGVSAPAEGRINAFLRSAIEVFDLFALHQARHGMTFFLGHNALLRTEAVADVGGLREGAFADDIDLSIRLARRGWRIVYAPHIIFGETHPPSYAAFRRRAYKWSFGCGQILRTRFLPAMLGRGLSFSQKVGLLEFVGFYAIQTILIAYLILAGIMLPLVAGPHVGQPPALFLSGVAVVVSIFLPPFAYFARRRRLSVWWPFALVCAVVYGSVAFASAHGLLDGLCGRRRQWVPTNLDREPSRLMAAGVPETCFGLALFLVPALLAPTLLWQPSMYLFALVFLLAPFVANLYVHPPSPSGGRAAGLGGGGHESGRRRRLALGLVPLARRAAIAVVLLGAISLVVLPFTVRYAGAARGRPGRVMISGQRILVDGAPFLVKGIHYSPWLPGTGPMKNYPWPGDAVIDRDLGMVESLGANVILVHDAPRSIFAAARRHHLMIIYTYFINWQSIGHDASFRKREAEIVRSASANSQESNLLAILLGNEVTEWVLKQKGHALIESRLRTLYDDVKAIVPLIPVSHANWPVTRSLDLSFMDLTCFNLYPAWPREVVLAGYGNYIESVLKPIANGRPLLITEFGQNSLEVTPERQAQVLRDAWAEIRIRAAGGVVFEFVDEWWKNYDNPIKEGDWWQRQYAPDDEKSQDLDPEEYYGIATSSRTAKPAYAAVGEMFREPQSQMRRAAVYALPLLIVFCYTLYVLARGTPREPIGR